MHFFLQKVLSCFHCTFRVIVTEYASTFVLVLVSEVKSSINTSVTIKLGATHSCTYLDRGSTHDVGFILISVRAVQKVGFQSFRVFQVFFWAKPNPSFLFLKPPYLHSQKGSLDCRLWQWYVYHLLSILDLIRCFLAKDMVIIHFGCPGLWSSRPPDVVELNAALFYRK